jgi:hypothetical protein
MALDWREPREIFQGLARALAPLAGLSYEAIGEHGADLMPATGAEP